MNKNMTELKGTLQADNLNVSGASAASAKNEEKVKDILIRTVKNRVDQDEQLVNK